MSQTTAVTTAIQEPPAAVLTSASDSRPLAITSGNEHVQRNVSLIRKNGVFDNWTTASQIGFVAVTAIAAVALFFVASPAIAILLTVVTAVSYIAIHWMTTSNSKEAATAFKACKISTKCLECFSHILMILNCLKHHRRNF